MRNLMPTLCFLAASLVAPLSLAASALDTLPLPDKFFDDRARVHEIVVALEQEPAHQNANMARAILWAHYEKDVDYLICGDVLGKLEGEKLLPVMAQIIIASGDWVEGHPDQAKDIDAYTLAGLESGVRVYKIVLAADPKARNATMDALVKEFDANTLSDWNKAHPCRPK